MSKKNGKSLWKEFTEFAIKGNAMALAVGTIIGAAFSTISKSLTDDIIMPIVSIFLGLIGFVKLLPIFAKFLKGEPTSADAFLNHGGGFVIAFVIMQLIRLVIM